MLGDSDRDKLHDLSQRIERAQESSRSAFDKTAQGAENSPLSRGIVGAVKLGSDFVALVMGMAFFGWLADRHLETAPWIMVGSITVGFVGGFWMLVHALTRKSAQDDQTATDGPKE